MLFNIIAMCCYTEALLIGTGLRSSAFGLTKQSPFENTQRRLKILGPMRFGYFLPMSQEWSKVKG